MEWIFLVLLVSGRFGYAEWNGPYIDVSWLVILVSLSGQSISFSLLLLVSHLPVLCAFKVFTNVTSFRTG